MDMNQYRGDDGCKCGWSIASGASDLHRLDLSQDGWRRMRDTGEAADHTGSRAEPRCGGNSSADLEHELASRMNRMNHSTELEIKQRVAKPRGGGSSDDIKSLFVKSFRTAAHWTLSQLPRP